VADGYTVWRKLRANPVTEAIPIILVTALDPESVAAATGDGRITILRKPCHAGEVLDSLNAVLDLPVG